MGYCMHIQVAFTPEPILPMLQQQRLASMRQRAEALGGSLEVRRPGAGGTHIDVVFPATA